MDIFSYDATSEEDVFSALKDSLEKSNKNKIVHMEVISEVKSVLKIAVVYDNRDVQLLDVWFEKVLGKQAMRLRGNTINKIK